MLDRMVGVQASTNGALFVFSLSIIVFVIAAAVVWLVPKPDQPLQTGPGD